MKTSPVPMSRLTVVFLLLGLLADKGEKEDLPLTTIPAR
jgi:hypothetical protein